MGTTYPNQQQSYTLFLLIHMQFFSVISNYIKTVFIAYYIVKYVTCTIVSLHTPSHVPILTDYIIIPYFHFFIDYFLHIPHYALARKSYKRG